MKLATKLSMATASIALSFAAVGAKPAEAAFIGPYAPSNWTLINRNADGFVNTTGAPSSVTLFGGDNGSNSYGTTDYIVQAVADGVLSFKWNYSTADAAAFFDPFSFVKNGIVTNLFSSLSTTGQGTFSTNVAAGDFFSFQVKTSDNKYGRGSVTISDFSAPFSEPVPEPLTIASSAIALGFGAWMKRKQAGVTNKA
ncbi:PEP-CTERM sorting domain-containing protein [Calothrix sp. NIES-2098]|uniref:PEP-CTERM sorting domain-containing protein n=1 Tax=Calothrix sp. NIES-2098 TaxID=1954171 RepID=UPI000B60C125|nr:hypothetical protein NIES2098_71250 [Calothrix sp. NIES-2098]